MNGTEIKLWSTYLNYLPGIYQVDAEKGALIGRYLKIFEKILSGIDDGVTADQAEVEGIERIIDRMHEFFAPETTPGEFLDWLAGWAALILRQDWDETAKRRLIRKIIPLYAKRGTRSGLSEYLQIFVGPNVQLEENLPGIYVGHAPGSDTMTAVGINTFVGGLLPHFFIITIRFATITGIGFIQSMVTATKAIIDLEKPAHTYYALRLDFPGIYVGHAPGKTADEDRTRVGMNTIIGPAYPFFV